MPRPPARILADASRCLLAVALAQPSAAHPIALHQLLQLPIETLLRLEYSASPAAGRPGAAPPPPLPGRGGGP